MDVEYLVGSFGVAEVIIFDFDIQRRSTPRRWFSAEIGRAKVLEEVEACVGDSRSLFCMWRVRGEVGSCTLSPDTLRTIVLPALAGSGGELFVCCVPVLAEFVADGFSSLWSFQHGGRHVRGGVCVKKAWGQLHTRFEAAAIYTPIEITSAGSREDARFMHFHLEERGTARRCSRRIDSEWEEVASVPIAQAAAAEDVRS